MEELDLYRSWRQEGSSEALVALLEALHQSAFSICFRILQHRQDAEDAAQKVLVEGLDVLRTLPSLDRLRGWIYRASILTALSLKRARLRRLRHERTSRPA